MTGDISILAQFHNGSKQTNALIDIQEICDYLEKVYKHPENVSKTFRKISHPEQEISLYLSNFSKKLAN